MPERNFSTSNSQLKFHVTFIQKQFVQVYKSKSLCLQCLVPDYQLMRSVLLVTNRWMCIECDEMLIPTFFFCFDEMSEPEGWDMYKCLPAMTNAKRQQKKMLFTDKQIKRLLPATVQHIKWWWAFERKKLMSTTETEKHSSPNFLSFFLFAPKFRWIHNNERENMMMMMVYMMVRIYYILSLGGSSGRCCLIEGRERERQRRQWEECERERDHPYQSDWLDRKSHYPPAHCTCSSR